MAKQNKDQGTAQQEKQTDPTGVADHPRTKSGKLSPNGLPCLCGCGAATVRTVAKFQSGHDAKLKGRMVRMAEGRVLDTDEPIPTIAIPFLVDEGIAGFRMVWKEEQQELVLVPPAKR